MQFWGAPDPKQNINKNKRITIISKVRNDPDFGVELAEKTYPLADDRAWIESQPSEHYTLQIAASDTLNKEKQFAGSLDLPESTFVFPYIKTGRSYFGVIYGNYSSENEAIEAITRLPESVLRQGPWPRSFSAVRSAMDRNGESN